MARVTFQETMDRLLLLIRAGYPVIYIVSHEETRILECVARLVRVLSHERQSQGLQGKHLVRWYKGTGLQEVMDLVPAASVEPHRWLEIPGFPNPAVQQPRGGAEAEDAIGLVKDANPAGFEALSDTVAIFFDVHPFLQVDKNSNRSGDLVRPLRNAADQLRIYYNEYRSKNRYKTIIIVAPSAAGLSSELERDIIQIDFPLPEQKELLEALNRMLDDKRLVVQADPPSDEVAAVCRDPSDIEGYRSRLCELVSGAGRGLTLEDYRSGLNIFSVRNQPLSSRLIEDMLHLKSKAISNPALQYTPHVKVSLGGLKMVNEWIELHRDAASSQEVRKKYNLPPPRGLMLLGVSGGGKSQLAKLVAKEFNLALLRMDVGALFGSYIGESEERTRMALNLAEVLAPVVLWIDEIDKSFQGIGDGGDNGVSARVFGQFLTWLAEKEDSVFVVATANDFRTMLRKFPELSRKGRFDEILWVDLPSDQARQHIFRIYLTKERDHQVDPGQPYLRIRAGEVESLAQGRVQGLPSGGDDLERLCWVLSQGPFSERLTGAEIQYAITDAKYRAYEDGSPILEVKHVAAAVLAAKDRALYRPGSEADVELQLLRTQVNLAGWPMV